MASPRAPLQPDVAGDMVRIDPPVMTHAAPEWWWYGAVAAMALGLWLMGEPFGLMSAWWMWCLFIGVYTILRECGSAYQRWLASRLTPRNCDGSPSGLALQAWRAAALKRDCRAPFNAGVWIDRTGPNGPRFIAISCEPQSVDTPPDLAEAVDMGSGRRMSVRERRHMVWLLILSLVQVGLNGLLVRGPALGNPSLLVLVIWLGYGVWSLNRLGVRPFSLTAAVATPGRLETSWFGRDAVFTRADSVLLLKGTTHGTEATLIRTDGRTFKITFMRPDADQMHPALVDLLARWCCRDAD